MAKPLRVGIIGASAGAGWAREGHVPAVQRLPGLELAAVATSSRETADAAAKAFGVPMACANGMDLIRAPEIDLATIAVPIQGHRELVLAPLAAGKHIYCKWPLGRPAFTLHGETTSLTTASPLPTSGTQRILRGSSVTC